jgi:hypothetical protein
MAFGPDVLIAGICPSGNLVPRSLANYTDWRGSQQSQPLGFGVASAVSEFTGLSLLGASITAVFAAVPRIETCSTTLAANLHSRSNA